MKFSIPRGDSQAEWKIPSFTEMKFNEKLRTAKFYCKKIRPEQDESIPHSHKRNIGKILKNFLHLWTF